jgi:ribosome-associated translation inhibitor RaiA|tara:strand:- start:287 stop:502 length:216 start_codon:yes stop_codon:yes gene_type:complete
MSRIIQEISKKSKDNFFSETTIEYENGNVKVSKIESHEPYGAAHDSIEIPFNKLEKFVKKVKKNIENNSNS